MQKQGCHQLTSHINRIQGQMDALKRMINAEKPCSDIVHLMVSVSRSFDSLRARMVEGYVREAICKKNKKQREADIDAFVDIVKN